jgi:hypothetical protein
MLENEVPVAQEITTSEYFDLWWQSMTQNPADNVSAGSALVFILVAVVVYVLKRKTPTSP